MNCFSPELIGLQLIRSNQEEAGRLHERKTKKKDHLSVTALSQTHILQSNEPERLRLREREAETEREREREKRDCACCMFLFCVSTTQTQHKEHTVRVTGH